MCETALNQAVCVKQQQAGTEDTDSNWAIYNELTKCHTSSEFAVLNCASLRIALARVGDITPVGTTFQSSLAHSTNSQ